MRRDACARDYRRRVVELQGGDVDHERVDPQVVADWELGPLVEGEVQHELPGEPGQCTHGRQERVAGPEVVREQEHATAPDKGPHDLSVSGRERCGRAYDRDRVGRRVETELPEPELGDRHVSARGIHAEARGEVTGLVGRDRQPAGAVPAGVEYGEVLRRGDDWGGHAEHGEADHGDEGRRSDVPPLHPSLQTWHLRPSSGCGPTSPSGSRPPRRASRSSSMLARTGA